MTGASAAMRASSRGPTPPGNGMRMNPTDQASAYAPAAIGSTLTPLPVTPATSSQACTLKNAHPASDQAAARSTPEPLTRRSSGGRRARRSARSSAQPITGGYRASSAGGASASAHQYWRAAAPELSGSATAATSSPVASVTSIATTVADAERRRGTSCPRASSTCAAIAQTEPGTYLPSCATNRIRAAARNGSGEPRSASSVRQDSIMQPSPAITATAAPATEYQAS
jgi:hypothetical protein